MTNNTIPHGDTALVTERMKAWRAGVVIGGASQAEAAALLGMSTSAYGVIERSGEIDRRTHYAMRLLWSLNHVPPESPI